MGFSALLLQSSGICCVGGSFGAAVAAEHCSSSGSPLFGRPWPWPQPARVNAVHINPKFVVAAVRNEGAENREEEKQKKKQLLGVASASIGFNTVLLMSITKPVLVPASPRKDVPYSWLSLPLLAVWGAILVNALVQFKILERLTWLSPRRESLGGRVVDFTLNQRVAELEEDVREFVTTARGLSKQVEKLGVRFRATKLTLRDPMQETAIIAQKTSVVANLLAQREERLEEELRELQRALLAMQEHQVKQLALISLVLKKTQNPNNTNTNTTNTNTTNTNNSNEGPVKEKLSSSVNGSSIKTFPDTHARKGGAEKASVGTPKPSLERASNSKHHISGSNNGNTSISFSSEGSLSKIDFWKDNSSVTSASPSVVASPADKSELGNFFNSRKQSSSSQERSPSSSTSTSPSSSSSPRSPPEKISDLNAELEPAEEYVEQPDYDSDSWLR